jgi:asparagine synthase (glutamine-hydrolysing)
MCGIAGAFAPGGTIAFGADVAEAMCRAITHRGPDDQGIYSHPGAHIGMRRLAIIDLYSGHQPIHNEDRSIWIVFNGEIYNFKSLRTELEAAGHRFYTNTDTECIVHAYEQFGEECFSRLRGMFAVAILDLRQNRLVLARDRLGKKPLYHTRLADGTVAFASELKSLFALPGFDPRVSQTATRDFFALGYVPGPGSIYEGVGKLPPAHTMVVQGDRCELRPYWSPAFEPKWSMDERSCAQQLLEHLEDAVRARLVSDVPFGAFLSGGLDSSVVAALMARNMGQPVKTFSIGFREAAFNELPHARRMAEHIGADHHEQIVDADAVAMLDQLAWHFDEPFGDASAIPTYLVARMAAGHVKMVLSGDGGDELFAGYDRYVRYQRLRALRERSLGLAGPGFAAAGWMLPGPQRTRLGRIGARLMQRFPDDYLSGVALATRADLREILALDEALLDPFASVREAFTAPADIEPLDRILRGDMATYLLEDILVKVDRMTMAHSLEARSPLLDHQLFEFVARLPTRMKLRDGTGKVLLKQVARQLLPADLLDKPKQGFAIPLAQWLRGPLRERLQDVLASRSFRERGLFHLSGVRRCVESHLAGRHDFSELLWLVLNYETWARRFLDQPAAAGRTPMRVEAPARC